MPSSNKISSDAEGNQATQGQQERRIALVVGVDHAPHAAVSALQYAESDAQAVAAALVRPACGFQLVKQPLLGPQATTTLVREALLDLADQLGPDDLLLLYFSGHGQLMTIEADRQDVYLVTHDFNERHVRRDENAHLSMRWLQDKILRNTDIGKVLLLLDCCYAGGIGEAMPDPYLQDLRQRLAFYLNIQNTDSSMMTGEARLTLAATSPTTKAREKDGQGIFTTVLLRALDGEAVDEDGYVTILELYQYLQRHLANEQVPGLYGFDRSRYRFSVAYYPHRAIATLRMQMEDEQRHKRDEELRQLARKVANELITDPDFFSSRARNATSFDHLIQQDAFISDLDMEKIRDFFKQDRVLQQEDYHVSASTEQLLENFSLVRGSKPVYGALLCFGKRPQSWIVSAETHCIV